MKKQTNQPTKTILNHLINQIVVLVISKSFHSNENLKKKNDFFLDNCQKNNPNSKNKENTRHSINKKKKKKNYYNDKDSLTILSLWHTWKFQLDPYSLQLITCIAQLRSKKHMSNELMNSEM